MDYELMTNGFESAEIRFVERFLRPGMTVLDVGAHHGLYTLLASKLVGREGKVISFEPSPRERARLTRHVKLNCARNVRIETCALGSENGEAELYLADGVNDWCNSLRRPTESSSKTVKVEVRSLDSVVSSLGISNVGLLKIDIEGGELDTLRGASKLLARAPRPVILAEVYDIRTQPFGYPARDIVRFVANANYLWFAPNEDGSLEPVSAEQDAYNANLIAVPLERYTEIMGRESRE